MYDLKNVQLTINNKKVLEPIDLKVESGEFIYLVGKSGIGKSMLLKILYTVYPQYSGKVLWQNQEVSRFSELERKNYRTKVGYMSQENILLSGKTIYEQLLYPVSASYLNHPTREKQINSLLSRLALSEKKNQRIEALSGGERQRVRVARLLLKDCAIFLLDEPTSQLDPKMSDKILTLLEEKNQQGKTIIMSTHDERLREKCPKRTMRLVEKRRIFEMNQLLFWMIKDNWRMHWRKWRYYLREDLHLFGVLFLLDFLIGMHGLLRKQINFERESSKQSTREAASSIFSNDQGEQLILLLSILKMAVLIFLLSFSFQSSFFSFLTH